MGGVRGREGGVGEEGEGRGRGKGEMKGRGGECVCVCVCVLVMDIEKRKTSLLPHHSLRWFVLATLSLCRLHLTLSIDGVVNKLACVRVETSIEKRTVAETLVRVLLNDLPEMELAACTVRPPRPSAAVPRLMDAELLQLRAACTLKFLQL